MSKIRVAQLSDKKNKWIVYEEISSSKLKPLSGIQGTSRTTAFKIAKEIKNERKKPIFIKEPYGLPYELQPTGKFRKLKKVM